MSNTQTASKIDWSIDEMPTDRVPADPDAAAAKGFGVSPSDRMLTLRYSEKKGWHDGHIGPFEDFHLSPMTVVFHYAQEIFEGQKFPEDCFAEPQPAQSAEGLRRLSARH